MPAEIDIAVVGAGVIGLAIASEIAHQNREVFIFEKNRTFGLETSGRNSEVIHAGIYYPEDCLKTKLCVEGRGLLYDLCERHGIGFRKLGKIILAVNENEITRLEDLYKQGSRNGVDDLVLLSRTELKDLEPNVEGIAGLLSPSTGIIDSHSLLRFFYNQAIERGAKFVFNTQVTGMEKVGIKYKLRIRDRDGESALIARVVINAAGLNSDKIAQLLGIDVGEAGYRTYYCKGEYFSLSSRWKYLVNRLIYPIPEQAGLGIHVTLGLDNRVRLGPNARYIGRTDYRVDETQKEAFFNAAKRFLPLIELEDLEPEFAGIRPKLQAPGEPLRVRDFVIAHEEKIGYPGFINLIGIETPGLTASPAIARHVAKTVKEFLD